MTMPAGGNAETIKSKMSILTDLLKKVLTREKIKMSSGIKNTLKIYPVITILVAAVICYSGILMRDPAGYLTHMIKWDISGMGYPVSIYNSDSIRNFILPLWDPYTYSGRPHLSDPQVMLLHPLTLLMIIFGGYSFEMLQLHLFLTFFIAGVAMYFCLRGFAVSVGASLIGSISFLACGFFVGNAEHFTLVSMLAVLPLSLMAVNKVIGEENGPDIAIGACTITLLAFCGYPVMFVICLYFLFAFGAVKILYTDKMLSRSALYRFSRMSVVLLLGTLAAGIMLLPAFVHTMASTKNSGFFLDSIRTYSLNPVYFANIFFPYLATVDIPSLTMEISLRNCSFGLVGVFFAIYFVLFDRRRPKYPLILLLLIFTVLAVGAKLSIYAAIVKLVPFLRYVNYPAMIYRGMLLLLLCMFSGFGADIFFKAEKPVRIKNGTLTFFFMTLLMLATVLYMRVFHKLGITYLTLHDPFLPVVLLILFGIILLSARLPTRWIVPIFIVLCIMDTSHWAKTNFYTVADPVKHDAWDYVRKMESRRNRRVDNNAVFQRQEAPYPVSCENNLALVNKYFTTGGYNPLILKCYDQFIRSSKGHMLTEDFRILPISEVLVMSDEKSVLEELSRAGTDLHKAALLNEKDVKDKALLKKLKELSPDVRGGFSGRILHYSPNVIEYEINNDQPVLLFFNEIYYPGWKLLVDGKRTEVFRVNHTFRGAYIIGGAHRLKMYFLPGLFLAGSFISMLSVAFMILLIKRRKPQGRE